MRLTSLKWNCIQLNSAKGISNQKTIHRKEKRAKNRITQNIKPTNSGNNTNGAVVSTSDYEPAGLSLIPDEGRGHTAHPAVHPFRRVGQ